MEDRDEYVNLSNGQKGWVGPKLTSNRVWMAQFGIQILRTP